MLSTDQPAEGGLQTIGAFHRIKALFMLAAFASLVLSVTLWFTGSRDEGLFVGIWVPAIHSLGTLILTGERERLEGGGRP
ncbi:MAG: hypothetical protein AAF531_19360 [Actinomycetota bacterium]